MFFRKIYGTKASIREEPLVLNHIETYILSPNNVNFTTNEEDKGYIAHEHTTPLAEVLDNVLDEWANAFQFDLVQEEKGIGLGTYCILEENAPIPNLMKKEENTNGLWDMFFDG